MDAIRACEIADGFGANAGANEIREAWQYLVDTGLAWQLQGRIGRTAITLLNAGEINPPSPRADGKPHLDYYGQPLPYIVNRPIVPASSVESNRPRPDGAPQ